MVAELIYASDCPNVTQARGNLLRAFAKAGIQARWIEWERHNADSPPYVQAFGSPTILVDGKDIAGAEPTGDISCCRLYRDNNEKAIGVPSVENIGRKLATKAMGRNETQANGWRTNMVVFSGIATVLLPKAACPACWPIYAGVLSSLGLGFLLKTVYLFPLTAAFLFIAVVALAYKAKLRKGYGPFILGVIGAGMVLIGKFMYQNNPVMYGGIILLLTASFWNAWHGTKNGGNKESCPACS